ncbi:hypothetical protein [Mycobacterium uberis]
MQKAGNADGDDPWVVKQHVFLEKIGLPVSAGTRIGFGAQK